jgi:glutamyl-tRNA reductase
MKYDPNEEYGKWVERVRAYEYGLALQRMAQGEPMEKIVEDMGRRITEKLLHPWLLKLKENAILRAEYDAGKSKKSYEENYLNRFPRVADHVVRDDEVNSNGK